MKTPNKHIDPPFSVTIFLSTVAVTLILYCSIISFALPKIWAVQLGNIWKLSVVFLAGHMVTAFFEFAFHRYMLHRPFPLLNGLFKQHEYHHDLTLMKLINVNNGIGKVFNRYPIIERIQHDASYFPWYALAAFLGFSLILSVPLQVLLPEWPILLGSALAVTWAILLYEVVHMIEHLSFEEFWKPKLTHTRLGRFWEIVYCFHLGHHANKECNENISGFFSIPVADLVFGTYARWTKAYTHGEEVKESDFVASIPRPCRLIRALDKLMPIPTS